MKRQHLLIFCTAIMLLGLSSCSKDIVDEQRAANSLLNIVTRAGDTNDDDGATTVKTGRIYIFNDQLQCVSVLNIDEQTQDATTKLPAGTYSVYAVGGFDVDRMSLPTQSDAKPTSELQLLSDKVMDDLLMQHTEAMTLSDGDDRTLTLTLERQVLRIDQVAIKQVPDDVTKVEVILEPFYKKVCLDGTFPTETEAIPLELADQGEGKWLTEPELYHFPSKGKPVITVRFTRPSGTKSYSYTASEELPANHKVKIEGTYTQKEGVSLTGVLTGTEWGEDKVITFDFDDTNSTTTTPETGGEEGGGDTPSTDAPEVGSFYQGCYVLSVSGKNVTLVSPTEQIGLLDGTKTNAQNIEILNNKLATWTAGDDVTGNWRIPTEDEARTFLLDTNCVETSSTSGIDYFCMTGDELMVVTVKYSNKDNAQVIAGTSSDIAPRARLRPVIDITLP